LPAEAPDIALEVVDTGAACLHQLLVHLVLLDKRLPDMDSLAFGPNAGQWLPHQWC
jgi:hypothetical protein